MTVRSDKPTRRQMMSLHWRGMRLLSHAIPHLFTAITLHTLVSVSLPYIAVWLLSKIVVAWETEWVLAALVTETSLLLLGGVLKRWKESRWECLYRETDSLLSDKLLSLGYADLHDDDTKALLSQVREDMSALGLGLVRIPDIYQHLLTGVFGVVAAVVLTWKMLWSSDHWLSAAVLTVLLAVLSVGALLLSRVSKQITDRKTDNVVPLERSYYAFYDTMFDEAQAAEIRLYGGEMLISKHLEQTERTFFGKDGLKRRYGRGAGGVLKACAASLSAVWSTAVLVVAERQLVGAFGMAGALLCASVLMLLYGYVAQWCQSISQRCENAPYLQRMMMFLDLPHGMYQGSLTTEKRTDCDYELEFRHVSFRYPGETTDALCDVSLTLRRGDRLAVVGENGSGKSTFVKLLCRLYDPDEGEILLNGIDIRKYRYTDYIALISAVFQDFHLLSQPLGNNVAGSGEVDCDKARRSLENVGFGEDLFLMEHGLDTVLYRSVFGDGKVLSVGDEQKIAIARALYQDAPFIVLDEPTAALDPVTEAEIYENLDRIVGDRTAIFISHRLSSCRFCKEIAVFDRGRIIQRGTHDELVKETGGQYQRMWCAQAQYYIK